jgi:hypothetical protein
MTPTFLVNQKLSRIERNFANDESDPLRNGRNTLVVTAIAEGTPAYPPACGERSWPVEKHFAPFAEGLIGGDQQ